MQAWPKMAPHVIHLLDIHFSTSACFGTSHAKMRPHVDAVTYRLFYTQKHLDTNDFKHQGSFTHTFTHKTFCAQDSFIPNTALQAAPHHNDSDLTFILRGRIARTDPKRTFAQHEIIYHFCHILNISLINTGYK
jgi:hypothetical protein